MAIVGEAFIAISPETDGFADETESQVDSAMGGGGIKAAATAAGAAAGTAFVAGAMEGIEREELNDRLAAQLNLTEQESEQAGAIAGSLYSDAYGDSLEGVNEAVGAVMGSFEGLGEAEVETLSGQALNLAETFDTDVNNAVNNVSILLSRGLVEDAQEGMDLITASMQEVPPAIRDELGEATTEYSKFFADLGISGEEMYGLLSQADDRFSLDKTGDAIKEFSTRATEDSTAVADAFETLDLDMEQIQDSLVAGGDEARGAMGEVVSALQGVESPSAQAQAAVELFGAPLEDLGKAQIPDFLDSLENMDSSLGDVGGRAEEMDKKLRDNAATSIDEVTRSVETMLAQVVEAPGPIGGFATAVAGIGQAAQPVAPALAGIGFVFRDQLSSLASRAGSAAGSVASSIGSLAGSVGRGAATVAASTGRMIASFASMAASAVANATRTAATMIAQWTRMAAASLAQAARMAASWVIAMGPVGWVIAAVVGLVALIVANWDTVVRWTRQAWDWVVDKVTAAWDWVWQKTSTAVSAVVGFVRDLRDRAVALIQRIVDFILKYHPLAIFLRLVIENVPKIITWVTDLVNRVVGWFQNLWDRAVEIVRGWVNGVMQRIRWMRDVMLVVVRVIRDRVVSFFTNLRDRVLGLARTIRDRVVGFFRGVRDRVVSIATTIRDRVVGFFTDLKDGAVEQVENVVEDVIGIKDRITEFFSNAGSWLIDAGQNIIQGLIDGIGDMVGNVGDKMSEVTGAIRDRIPFSPAKKGPLSGSGAPDIAGATLVEMIADGMDSRIGDLARQADETARAALVDLGAGGRPPTIASQGAGRQAQDAAARADGPLVGQINITASDPERAGDEIVRSLRERAYLGTNLGRG